MPGAGEAAADCIRFAAGAALLGQARAVVTAPIHKEALAAAGVAFPGHTELLQDSMEETLYNNPNDAFSHANIGWALLQNQEVEQAKTHFAEALRLDPNMKFARHGMIESIKSQNWIYRQFLAFSFFLNC